jgi:hypothetical protein
MPSRRIKSQLGMTCPILIQALQSGLHDMAKEQAASTFYMVLVWCWGSSAAVPPSFRCHLPQGRRVQGLECRDHRSRACDLLLIVAAILADSIGRLFHDLLTVRPPTLLQLKLWFALFLALGAGTCSIEFVVATGQQTPQVSSTDRAPTPNGGSAVENNLTSDAARANWMPGRVMKSSEVFFCFALVMGLFVILIVD